MAKKPSLLSQAKLLPTKSAGAWHARLPKELRAEVMELFAAKSSKAIDISHTQILQVLQSNGIKVSLTQFKAAYSAFVRGELS